jgi:GNAT superfamily N-acetyltransferase
MSRPASVASKSFPAGFSARKEDLGLAAFRDLFRKVGAPWLWTSRLTNPDTEVADSLADPNVVIWVIYEADTPVGLIELDFRERGSCELVLFGMVQAMMGKGLGGPMMALAQQEAFARNITRFHLSTCHLDSPQAMLFYRKSGFAPYRMAIEVFRDPRAVGALPADTAPRVAFLP